MKTGETNDTTPLSKPSYSLVQHLVLIYDKLGPIDSQRKIRPESTDILANYTEKEQI